MDTPDTIHLTAFTSFYYPSDVKKDRSHICHKKISFFRKLCGGA